MEALALKAYSCTYCPHYAVEDWLNRLKLYNKSYTNATCLPYIDDAFSSSSKYVRSTKLGFDIIHYKPHKHIPPSACKTMFQQFLKINIQFHIYHNYK